MTAERDALAELVAVHNEIRDVGYCETARLNAAWAAARAVLAAPAQRPRGESITFDALVAHGLANGANVVNGMPWSWDFYGIPVTHENDNCYLLCTTAGVVRVERPTAAPAHARTLGAIPKVSCRYAWTATSSSRLARALSNMASAR